MTVIITNPSSGRVISKPRKSDTGLKAARVFWQICPNPGDDVREPL
jgi:hypothetical protein